MPSQSNLFLYQILKLKLSITIFISSGISFAKKTLLLLTTKLVLILFEQNY